MPFTVVWDPALENDLIDAWINSDATVRRLITAASNWIDRTLGSNPAELGQRIPGRDERIVRVPIEPYPFPVFAVFEVLEDYAVVRVLQMHFHTSPAA